MRRSHSAANPISDRTQQRPRRVFGLRFLNVGEAEQQSRAAIGDDRVCRKGGRRQAILFGEADQFEIRGIARGPCE